ncbi:hypothetical protein HCUR_01525 [Holospora curviuscula]|uniref:Uncharacterized protein n=1 Tax=Holospora curviuscula TaxID=1082868 RepID=A0A2S5R706_9PROT|nr:hypothetical protein HCUR_01525 [Holospora curviuscula]
MYEKLSLKLILIFFQENNSFCYWKVMKIYYTPPDDHKLNKNDIEGRH